LVNSRLLLALGLVGAGVAGYLLTRKKVEVVAPAVPAPAPAPPPEEAISPTPPPPEVVIAPVPSPPTLEEVVAAPAPAPAPVPPEVYQPLPQIWWPPPPVPTPFRSPFLEDEVAWARQWLWRYEDCLSIAVKLERGEYVAPGDVVYYNTVCESKPSFWFRERIRELVEWFELVGAEAEAAEAAEWLGVG